MANPPRRVVARSTDTSALVPAIQFRGAAESLRHAQDEIRARFGLILPSVEPEYHVFPTSCDSVAAALAQTPAVTPSRTLRCVVEVERNRLIAHGTTARPVVLIQIGEAPKGWHSPIDGTYDAIACVAAPQVKQLLVDLFLDFSMSSSSYLQYIIEGYIEKFGFSEYGRRKSEFARSAGLNMSRFGAVSANATYVNFSILTNPDQFRDLDLLVRLWESFALDPAFKKFATVEAAVKTLSGKRAISSKITADELRSGFSALEPGAYLITTLINQPTREAFYRAENFIETMKARFDWRAGRQIVVAKCDALSDEFSKTLRDLHKAQYVTAERFIIHP